MADGAIFIVIHHEFDAAAARFRDAASVLADALVPAVFEGSLLLEREVRERTPTSGAGTLRDSIGALPISISGAVVRGGAGTVLAYAAPVETGSKPHWMPVEPLMDWVRRKLGLAGDEAADAARRIRFAIAHRGTPAAHMFRDGTAATEAQIGQILNDAMAEAAGRLWI